jgi:enoyl-CoA hydratase/carnithine racemase
VHIKIGLVPAWGGATYLSTLLGPRIALRFLSTTGRIDLEAAETIGFADRCVSTNPIETDEEVLSHAIRFLDPMVWTNPDQPAAKRVAHPAAAVRASKRVIQQKRARDEAESLEEERSVVVELWGGREMREAIGTRRKHG